MIITDNHRFLAHQGTAVHSDGNENHNNFHQLLMLCLVDNLEVGKQLQRKKDKYIHPDIQSKLLKVMALTVLRAITKDIQSCRFFTLMADKVADVSNKEQAIVCLCYIDGDFEAQEEFVKIHQSLF